MSLEKQQTDLTKEQAQLAGIYEPYKAQQLKDTIVPDSNYEWKRKRVAEIAHFVSKNTDDPKTCVKLAEEMAELLCDMGRQIKRDAHDRIEGDRHGGQAISCY